MASTPVQQLQAAIHSLQTTLGPDVPASCSQQIASISVYADALLQHHAGLQQELENKYVPTPAAVAVVGQCCCGAAT